MRYTSRSMRRGEVCALRWSDLNDDCTITVSHALGNAEGGFYLKEPKTGSSQRDIPLTKSIYNLLCMMKEDSRQRAAAFGFRFGDPFILGTQEPDSRPYNPTALGKDFTALGTSRRHRRPRSPLPKSSCLPCSNRCAATAAEGTVWNARSQSPLEVRPLAFPCGVPVHVGRH